MAEYELYHYGVKGMKWGVRRAHRKEAKQNYRKRTNEAFAEYERTINDIERPYKKGQNLSKKDQSREAAAEKKYRDTVAKAKSDYKNAKKNKPDLSPVSEYVKERKRQKNYLNTKHAIDIGSAFVDSYLKRIGSTAKVGNAIRAGGKAVLDYTYTKNSFK